jgi:glycosyltransferase involved in cell wall biosynthesis
MNFPTVTLAFLSWNRLHYLRATLESARRCIDYPNLEWIVSDNESVEPGLVNYIAGLDWVQEKWSRTQTHADAMNEIVSRATGKYLLIWPEDMQFVVESDWLQKLVSLLEQEPWIGSVLLNFLRRKTYRRLLGPPDIRDVIPALNELKRRQLRFRFPRRVRDDISLATFGWRLPGLVGSGIPSLSRLDHWRRIGPWRTGDPRQARLIDSSLGAEDDMIARFERSGLALQQGILMKPVAADIINDEYGSKAKVRRGKRYGNYTPPPSGDFYYEILNEAELPEDEEGYPLSFEKFVRPIGFSLPLDQNGDLRKASLNEDVVTEVASR